MLVELATAAVLHRGRVIEADSPRSGRECRLFPDNAGSLRQRPKHQSLVEKVRAAWEGAFTHLKATYE